MTILENDHDHGILGTQKPRNATRMGKSHVQFNQRRGAVDSDDTIGQFSFGPATQTTVVTTTTTTTTRFPPFVMRASRRPDRLDPKLYPLANAQTPAQLKRIVFSHHGKQVIFREAADTTVAFEDSIEEYERLSNGNGVLQSVQKSESHAFSNMTNHHRPTSKPTSDEPASPQSIDDEEETVEEDDEGARLDDEESLSSSLRLRRFGKQHTRADRKSRPYPRLRDVQIPSPLTPHTQTRSVKASQPHPGLETSSFSRSNSIILPSPDAESQASASATFSALPVTQPSSGEDIVTRSRDAHRFDTQTPHETTVPTPPVELDETQSTPRFLRPSAFSSIPSRLHVADSPSTQDGNLPSPSLSPVTAAANAQNISYFNGVHVATRLEGNQSESANNVPLGNSPSHENYESPEATEGEDETEEVTLPSPFSRTSIRDIPALMDYFEALPDDLKSYVIHQLLRRCPKSTLHVVAEAVNPALKCDFLTVLPPELALNILSYLDVKSLCKAAQVSSKWRQMINSDERAWKELFESDGFTLPEGELQTAITQGWGWQDPHGIDGFEEDLSSPVSIREENEVLSPGPATVSSKRPHSGVLRRSKRKAVASLTSTRNKQVKRQEDSREASADIEILDWTSKISSSEGPYNAATAAVIAVPNPRLQIPSLKGLHLYKSLYRRHHLIRRNWMYEETKPRHIAFKAHDSHVVTCLQFDTDKILTGSDDNNINVYDTKTGALRQLLRGHEGGVWALQYEGNTLVSGSTDRSVRVWDIENGVETQVFRGHTSTVRCLQIVMPVKVGETSEGKAIVIPKHPLIITGSRDSTLRVWRLPRPGDPRFIQAESDAEADDCPYFVRTLTGHQHSVRAIAAHADTLVSGSYDCTVRVWKVSTGETVHRLQGHSQKVYSVVLDHARNRCISGSMDNLVKIWSLDTGSALYTLEGHSSLVGLLDLNCDRLVSAAADSTLRIWDPENGQCKATLSAHTGAITCFQHDGQKVISGSDRTLKMWNIKTGECMKDLLSDLSGVWQVKFNERRCVAAVQRDSMTYIEVLDFGASRDGIPETQRGRRIVVDRLGHEIETNSEDTTFFD